MTEPGPHPSTTAAPIPGSPRAERTLSRGERALLATPDAVVVGLVALALAAGMTVSLGAHRPWTTLPLAGVLGWLLWLAVRPRSLAAPEAGSPASGLDRRIQATGILVAGAGAWFILNSLLAAEYLIVSRDPGFLTLSGLWLVDHPSTDIPARGAIEAAMVQPNFLADASQAWNLRGDMIQPQGAKMLPALISTGGWVGGTTGVLVFNVLVGAVGLVALYLVARRFLGPVWALVPPGLVGLSVAHIGLSKSPYTEPLTLVLVVTALAWAWRGIEERRIGAIVAAGAVTGATALVRIDGAAFAAGALAALVVTLALTARGDDAPTHRWRVAAFAGFAVAQLAFLAGGYASLWRWSEGYLERLAPEAKAVSAAYLGALVVAALWAATWNRVARGERLATGIVRALGERGARWAGGLVSGLLLLLASRPLWTTVHRGTETETDRFTNGVVEYFQRAQGLPIDPTRTYAEHTITWISYYLTWPVVFAAIAGFGIATYLAMRARPAWMLLIVGCLAPSVLYLLKPEIVPDQIWAIRRFESAAIPAFALAAALGAYFAVRWLEARVREPWRGRLPAIVAGALLALPVTAWLSFEPRESYPVSVAMHVATREMAGARAQVDELCAVVGDRPIVLYGTSSHFGTLRTRCDVPLVLALEAPTPESLRKMSAIWGAAPVVLTRQPEDLAWTANPGIVVDSTVEQAEYRLQGIPRTVAVHEYLWYAGVPDASGELVPLEGGATLSPAS